MVTTPLRRALQNSAAIRVDCVLDGELVYFYRARLLSGEP